MKKMKKTALLSVPRIVATTLILAHAGDSTSVPPTVLHTEVFAPTDSIGMMRKSRSFIRLISHQKEMSVIMHKGVVKG